MNIVITRFPYESALGGEEFHTIGLAKFLREEHHRVTFAGSCPILLSLFEQESFPVAKVWGGRMAVTTWELITFMCTWPLILVNFWITFSKIFRQQKVDVLYCLSLNEKILLTPLALIKNIRVIWVEHQYLKGWLLNSPLKYPYRLWSKKVTIVPISPVNERTLRDQLHVPEANINPIVNGVNCSQLNRRSRMPERQPRHFGTSIRLIEKKGGEILIRSFGQLSHKEKNLHLEVIGEGPEKESLASLVENLRLGDRVTFLGTLSRNEYEKKLLSWDVFVLPSIDESETFGLVAAEAMAAGCKTIVTRACGISHYLPESNGVFIAEPNSPESLTKRMEAALSDTTVNRNKISTLAEKLFDEKRMLSEYLRLMSGTHRRQKIKLLFIDQGEHMGGAELFLAELVARLNPSHFEITIAGSGNPDHKNRYAKLPHVTYSRVHLQKLKPLTPGSVINFCRSFFNLRNLVRKIKPNLLISNTVRTHILSSIVAKTVTVPLIWIQQDFTFPKPILNLLVRVPKQILVCSSSVADFIITSTSESMSKKIRVIYPFGVDESHLSHLSRRKKDSTIGMVGKIIPWKGQEYFIRSLQVVVKRFPNVKAVIIGSTYKNNPESEKYFNHLGQLQEQLGLTKNLEFKNRVENIYREISDWGILIHASIEPEPFGRVVPEAMVCGAVVIASHLGGPTEIIEHGVSGFLVDPLNTTELSETIINILSNNELRDSIASAAHQKITAKMNWKEKITELEELFREVTESSSC